MIAKKILIPTPNLYTTFTTTIATAYNNNFSTNISNPKNNLTTFTTTKNTQTRFLILFIGLVIMLLGLFMVFAPNLKAISPVKTSTRRNTIIILDLSDRILVPGVAAKDQQLIFALLNRFHKKAKEELFLLNDDRVRIIIAPQDGTSYDADSYQELLIEDMANLNEVQSMNQKKLLGQRLDKMKNVIKNLYTDALKPGDRKKYAGANMWKLFNEDLNLELAGQVTIGKKVYLQENEIFVLTDGYLDFESYREKRKIGNKSAHSKWVAELVKKAKENWEGVYKSRQLGFLSLTRLKAANPTSVTVYGVNPHADHHLEILEYAWKEWLESGGMKLSGFYKRSLLTGIETKIEGMP